MGNRLVVIDGWKDGEVFAINPETILMAEEIECELKDGTIKKGSQIFFIESGPNWNKWVKTTLTLDQLVFLINNAKN